MLYNSIITDSTTFAEELNTMQSRLQAMIAEYKAQYDTFEHRISAFLQADATWTDEDEARYDELKEQRDTLWNAILELESTERAMAWAVDEVTYVDDLVEDLPDASDDLPHDDEEEEPEWTTRESYLYEQRKEERTERYFDR